METSRQAALGGREGFPGEAGEAEPGDILPALGPRSEAVGVGGGGAPVVTLLPASRETREGPGFGMSTLRAFGGPWGP